MSGEDRKWYKISQLISSKHFLPVYQCVAYCGLSKKRHDQIYADSDFLRGTSA